ncbi:hypothetical protein EK21DRAFT_91469 [Setomelanomma holmii]|uniref:Uncharacterized protein n=1 Tax=Setomelanomma holmii TaxID=210430 RepID=A0A9P4LI43_9PLEO|nr:hypothetical protein EK21DRAFT_91469 [Setomelanomma holmii]
MFKVFQKASAQPSTPIASPPNATVVNRLDDDIVKLRDQRDELQFLYESNRQTFVELDTDLQNKTSQCSELQKCISLLDTQFQATEASSKKTVAELQTSISTLKLELEQVEGERDDAINKFNLLRTRAYSQFQDNDETIDDRNDMIEILKADKRKLQQWYNQAQTEVQALKYQRNGATELQTALEELQNNCDSVADCNMVLKRSLRAREDEVAKLGKQLDEHRDIAGGTLSATVCLQEQLNVAQIQIAELQIVIQENRGLILVHKTEKSNLRASITQLKQERDQLLADIATHTKQISSLQHENDHLATCAARSDMHADNFKAIVQARKKELRSFSQSAAVKEASYRAQVDAMYAQQQQAEQRFQTQLKAKKSTIQDLDTKLKQSEAAAAKAAIAKDDQIAALQEQIRRMTLDCNGETSKAESWQHFANEKQAEAAARAAALEAKNSSLAAKLENMPAVCDKAWCKCRGPYVAPSMSSALRESDLECIPASEC